ncbi:MAG: enoyl-CoA hydratase/isomerase family protein [Clostridiales Family XIII bacterium]|jgi:enoyl-CoA hydratase|nr:enoyl-CoA hydratase/isomerase family protein [Clostridiales Family XIII bacterium]
MKSYTTLLFEQNGKIGIVKINRPEALNALNETVLEELSSIFDEIEADDSIGVVILTGEGRSFVAGADIAAMKEMNAIEGRAFMLKGQAVMQKIETLSKVVIAAVNGFALGGGCEISMACDIRLASEKAKFGQPEVNLGIIPGFGGTQRLPRLVGKGMAKYLIFSTETIGAEEAKAIGLVEKVYPPETLIEEAVKLAETILSKAPIAISACKAAINNGLNADLPTGIAFEAEASATPFGSEDRIEGMGAFLEKRAAAFKSK